MLSSVMPYHKRHYSRGQLQFITTSTYRRAPLFLSDRFRRCFAETLARARRETKFLVIGWVLMPDHFHLLLIPRTRDRGSQQPDRQAAQSGIPLPPDDPHVGETPTRDSVRGRPRYNFAARPFD